VPPTKVEGIAMGQHDSLLSQCQTISVSQPVQPYQPTGSMI
jgi:hypothetical protein